MPKNRSISHGQTVDVEILKFRRNARRHDPEQIGLIAGSLTKFGWVTPVLIDEENVVLAGYGRVEAARQLGIRSIPVMRANHWTDAEKRAYMLADNQIALRAGWDEQLLALELQELQLLDFDLNLLGFQPIELGNLEEYGSLQRPIGDLKARFIVAPFTVLDTRSAWWQERKRGWLALGIKSEIGRRDNPLGYSETIRQPDPKKRKKPESNLPYEPL